MKSLRIRLFLSHLGISAAVIGSCVAFIILVWYPPPFAQLEGIFSILLVMAGVDICAGPLCTLVAASPKKSRGHLARDLAVIGAVQLVALGYALYTTCIARPAYVVYSVGQFEVEHANEIAAEELAKATDYSSIPLTGPQFVEARFPDDEAVTSKIVKSALEGGPDIKDMPQYYRAWPFATTDAREKGKPAASLSEGSVLKDKVTQLLQAKSVAEADAMVLTINGKIDRGTVVVRKSDLAIIGIVPFLSP